MQRGRPRGGGGGGREEPSAQMLLMMYSCTGRRLEDVMENRHKDKRNPHPLCSISVGFDFCGIASLVVLSALRKRPCSVGCWARTGDCVAESISYAIARMYHAISDMGLWHVTTHMYGILIIYVNSGGEERDAVRGRRSEEGYYRIL